MKKTKFLATCKEYDDLLKEEGFIIKCKEPFTKVDTITENENELNHIRWMLNAIPLMIDDPKKLERVNRWIGFIQGSLWSRGYYSIEEMKGKSGDLLIENDTFYYLFEGGVSDITLE